MPEVKPFEKSFIKPIIKPFEKKYDNTLEKPLTTKPFENTEVVTKHHHSHNKKTTNKDNKEFKTLISDLYNYNSML